LHAWNESFFKLCVFDCGRFLRADNYTKEKDRLDFARVLIATTSLEVIKRVERLLVDDTVVEVQVVEEWGYDVGDDACILLDDEAYRHLSPIMKMTGVIRKSATMSTSWLRISRKGWLGRQKLLFTMKGSASSLLGLIQGRLRALVWPRRQGVTVRGRVHQRVAGMPFRVSGVRVGCRTILMGMQG
jgi:hypothetical protein